MEEEAKKKVLDGAEVLFSSWLRASVERSATVKQPIVPGESYTEFPVAQKQGMNESGHIRGIRGSEIWVEVNRGSGDLESHMKENGGVRRNGLAIERCLSSERSVGEQGSVGKRKSKQGSRREEGDSLEVVREGSGTNGLRVSGVVYEIGEQYGRRVQGKEVEGDEQRGEFMCLRESKRKVFEKVKKGEQNAEIIKLDGRVSGEHVDRDDGGVLEGVEFVKRKCPAGEEGGCNFGQDVEMVEDSGECKISKGTNVKGMSKAKAKGGRDSGCEVIMNGKPVSPPLNLKIAQLRRKRGGKDKSGSRYLGERDRDGGGVPEYTLKAVEGVVEARMSRQVGQKRRKLVFVGGEVNEIGIPGDTNGGEEGIITVEAEPVEQAHRLS